jgi:hypothetical protein
MLKVFGGHYVLVRADDCVLVEKSSKFVPSFMQVSFLPASNRRFTFSSGRSGLPRWMKETV